MRSDWSSGLRSWKPMANGRSSPPDFLYIYLGLGSYRLTIKERNGGVGIRVKNRLFNESTSCVANMNCEGFYDGETELL